MSELVDIASIAKVKGLDWIAQKIARGYLSGLHQSTSRGSGIEFSQYRAYEPGDPLSSIDWKLFARADRYFVREAHQESDLDLWMVLDASASMSMSSLPSRSKAFKASKAPNALSKLDFAKTFLASLSFIAKEQGDGIGLLSLQAQQTHAEHLFIPAKQGHVHWQSLALGLHRLKPANGFPDLAPLRGSFEAMRKHGVVIVVSDFCQYDQELLDMLAQFNTQKTDVICVQLMCDDELNFAYKGQVEFIDPETKKDVKLSADEARALFLNQLTNYQTHLKQAISKLGMQYLEVNIDKPIHAAMHALFSLTRHTRV